MFWLIFKKTCKSIHGILGLFLRFSPTCSYINMQQTILREVHTASLNFFDMWIECKLLILFIHSCRFRKISIFLFLSPTSQLMSISEKRLKGILISQSGSVGGNWDISRLLRPMSNVRFWCFRHLISFFKVVHAVNLSYFVVILKQSDTLWYSLQLYRTPTHTASISSMSYITRRRSFACLNVSMNALFSWCCPISQRYKICWVRSGI